MGRGGGPRRAAPPRGEHRVHALGRQAATADLAQGPHDRADHLVEEPVAPDVHVDQVRRGAGARGGRRGRPRHVDGEQRARAVSVAVGAARERGEVVRAHEARAGRLHGREVERPRHVPGGLGLERTSRAPEEQPVAVELARGPEPGVEPGGRLVHGDDRHVVGQERVEARLEPLRRDGRARLEARHLPERVDPRIRPARACHPDGRPQQFGEGPLELALDGPRVGLDLPAREPGPVILEGEPERPRGGLGGALRRQAGGGAGIEGHPPSLAADPGRCHRRRPPLHPGAVSGGAGQVGAAGGVETSRSPGRSPSRPEGRSADPVWSPGSYRR